MSIPSSTIKCDKCDYTSSMSVTLGIYSYVDNGKEYNISRSLGWCYNCKKFVPIEDIGIDITIVPKIKEMQEKIKFVDEAGFWIKMGSKYKKLKRDYNFYNREIKNLKWRLSFLKNINRGPKCLVCGSENIESVDVKELDYHNPGPDKKLIDFKHPGCGGELWLIRNPIRWNLKFIPQLYDVEGNRLT